MQVFFISFRRNWIQKWLLELTLFYDRLNMFAVSVLPLLFTTNIALCDISNQFAVMFLKLEIFPNCWLSFFSGRKNCWKLVLSGLATLTRVVPPENDTEENNEYKAKMCFHKNARVKSYNRVWIFQLIVNNVATVGTPLLPTSILKKKRILLNPVKELPKQIWIAVTFYSKLILL